jgi:transcriptional regulator GlxA family with amidase domain
MRKSALKHCGRVVEHEGGGWIMSFAAASGAVACALETAADGVRLAISSGDPVEASDRLFGDALLLAKRLCGINAGGRVAVSVSVKNLLGPELYPRDSKQLLVLAQKDETLMNTLSDTLERHWQDPGFGVEQFCRQTTMSKSQLYRKTMELWALSPNDLLRRFRLTNACGLLRKQASSIAGVGFDSGFTSASYFTKCFKETFGVLPAAYLQMV